MLWLPIHTRELKKELYAPRPWEHWLHAAYFGRVYYWLEGSRVQPVHFRDYFFNMRGRTRDYQKLARKKVPIDGNVVSLTNDFVPKQRQGSTGQNISIPPAKLFMDSQPDWYLL